MDAGFPHTADNMLASVWMRAFQKALVAAININLVGSLVNASFWRDCARKSVPKLLGQLQPPCLPLLCGLVGMRRKSSFSWESGARASWRCTLHVSNVDLRTHTLARLGLAPAANNMFFS